MSDPALDKLLKQRAQLEARIQAKRSRLKQQERKADTRRKIIAGALALEHMGANSESEFTAIMARLLNRYVIRPADRALFDLPPLNDDQANDSGLADQFENQPGKP